MSKSLIYGLLLCVLMVTAPHAAHLPLWVSALSTMLLLWRGYLAFTGRPLPNRPLLLTITVASLTGILVEFHTLFGREVGVTLLMLLSALKLMEVKTNRDAMGLIYPLCFIIITNFFYSQSLLTGLYLLATLLVITVVWVHLHAPGSAFKSRLKIAAILLWQAIPLTLILFVLFPRVQGPLWGLPQDAYAGSGLDDKMSPGSLGRLSLSDAVAFRVTYQGKVPRRDQMYWRGPVLWDFDGRTWTPGHATRGVAPHFSDTGQPVEYNVTLEPHNKNWLFALEMPDKISVPARITSDFQILSPEPVNARLRYQARSELTYHANLQESATQLKRALQLPPGLNPRAQQLARSWHEQSRDNMEVIRLALANFHQQNFHYTLDPQPVDSIDDFLFTTRQGYCEHYASSFVFLMRAAGIPARVVTGYLGGEYNAVGNYYIVRQSDAHAWAEVWLDATGWQRIDPTAAISPERVERGLSTVQTATQLGIARAQWLHDLRMNWDALSYQWNQWVIGYNSERQFAYLSRLGLASLSQQVMYLAAGLGIVITLFALYMLRHLLKRERDKTQSAWLKVCRKLSRAGLPRAPHEGPHDYAARVAAARPDLAAAIEDLAERYIALRYEPSPNGHDKNATKKNKTRHARFPHPNPLPEGEGSAESLCEFHVNENTQFIRHAAAFKA
jgi:transglutaminase-like putative cysteine protease